MYWSKMKKLFAVVLFLSSSLVLAQAAPELKVDVDHSFKFVAFGDTRFTDPKNSSAANAEARLAIVQAIANEKPAFVCISGDIVYNGYSTADWERYDLETKPWRDAKLTVFPAIGNHELHGTESIALANYFQRFPQLSEHRYYSVRAGSVLILTLDSALEEISGPQGEWLRSKLDKIPSDVKFVIILLHHPPYTSSSDLKIFGGGHSARPKEEALAKMLEEKQKTLHAKIAVIAGHVHNYERQEHGGIMYFTSGGGGAHPYAINRKPEDLFKGDLVNFHYMTADVSDDAITFRMHRVDLSSGSPVWSVADEAVLKSADAK